MEGDVIPPENILQPDKCMEGNICPSVTILEPEKCTTNNCTIDMDQRKLHCTTCKRRVHYKCALLPPYQLQRYLTFGKSYCPYICASCVEVPEHLRNVNICEEHQILREKYKQEKQRSGTFKKEITTLNERICNTEKELCELKTKLHAMTNAEPLPSISNKSIQKKKRIDDENTTDGQNYNEETERKNQEIEQLRKQNETLHERLNERETALDETLQRLADADSPAVKPTEGKVVLDHIEKSIEERFNNMQEILINIIDKKLKSEPRDKSNRTYASTTSGENTDMESIQETRNHQMTPIAENFRSIMMSTRNEELAEQKDKKERACNIIIHGREENNEQRNDTLFVNSFLELVSGSTFFYLQSFFCKI